MPKNKIRTAISIDPDLKDKATRFAEQENRTFSNLVEVLLLMLLKAKK